MLLRLAPRSGWPRAGARGVAAAAAPALRRGLAGGAGGRREQDGQQDGQRGHDHSHAQHEQHGHSHGGVPCGHDHSHAHAQETVMALAGAPVNAFKMNMWVFADLETGDAAIVDAGAGTAKELEQFTRWLDDNDFRLTAVLQTHAHVDHVLGLGVLRKRYGQALPIYLHGKERPVYARAKQAAQNYGLGELDDLPQDWIDLEGKHEVQVGSLRLKVLETPGHSPGHVAFFEPRTKRLFGGDVLFQGSIGRTDFPESSPDDMARSLATLCQLPDDVLVLPGHGQPTTIGEEKETNPHLQRKQHRPRNA
jgi:hydroxyacylglutathione hydrolase